MRNGTNFILFLVQIFTAGGVMEISGIEGRSCYIDIFLIDAVLPASFWISLVLALMGALFIFCGQKGCLIWVGGTVFGHLLCCQAAHFLLLAPGTLDRHKWISEVKGLARWLGLLIFRGSGSPEVLVKIVSSVNVESVERLRTNPLLQFHALMHRPSFSFKAL